MEKVLQHDKLLQQTHMMMRHYLQEISEKIVSNRQKIKNGTSAKEGG